jgi:organic radical activating enzyme
MENIKRFISLYVPVTTCTLRCQYCYITQHRLFEGKLPEMPYSPEFLKEALSKKRLGGTCLINICGGGETLLPDKIVDYTKVLLEEGHYVMIVTNATITKRFEEIAKFPKKLFSHLFFKFSYHYLELKKKKLLDTFFDNVIKMRNIGCSFTLEITPHDELIPYIEEMNALAIKRVGATPHVTIARDERIDGSLPILTNMTDEDYYKTWGKLNSSLFDYKKSIFGVKRKEFCYAGSWSAVINISTGVMRQCYHSYFHQNIFKNINKPIRFLPIGNNCQEEHCYNGHAFLVLGIIPEIQAPTYGEIRNKKCVDGSEWLQPEMKAFMQTKLYDSNPQLSNFQKSIVNMEIMLRRIIKFPSRTLRKVKKK